MQCNAVECEKEKKMFDYIVPFIFAFFWQLQNGAILVPGSDLHFTLHEPHSVHDDSATSQY